MSLNKPKSNVQCTTGALQTSNVQPHLLFNNPPPHHHYTPIHRYRDNTGKVVTSGNLSAGPFQGPHGPQGPQGPQEPHGPPGSDEKLGSYIYPGYSFAYGYPGYGGLYGGYGGLYGGYGGYGGYGRCGCGYGCGYGFGCRRYGFGSYY